MARAPEKRILVPMAVPDRSHLEHILREDGWLPIAYSAHKNATEALAKATATAVIFFSEGNDSPPPGFARDVRMACPSAFILSLGGSLAESEADAVLGKDCTALEICTTLRLGTAVLDARATERALREQLAGMEAQARELTERIMDLQKTCTSLKEWAHSAQTLSLRDELTGLYNRRHFLSVAEQEVERARREETEFHLALVDIDHFKEFNDTFGHPAGDQMLKRFAGCLLHNFRRMDTVARYGGEEFVVLLPATHSIADAEFDPLGLMERLRLSMSKLVYPDQAGTEGAPHITISVGMARYPGDGKTIGDLVAHADERLYHAKANGRNRICATTDPLEEAG